MRIGHRFALVSCLACFTAGFASAGGAGAAAATIAIDFDGLSGMTYLTENPVPPAARLSTQFQDTLGVRFGSEAGYVAVVNLGSGHATSAPNGIGGVRTGDVLNYNRDIELTFSVPGSPGGATAGVTDFFSIRGDLIPSNALTATISAFDVNGQLIGSDSEPDVGGMTLSVAQAGIHRVVVSGVALDAAGNSAVAFDDVMFNPVTPVPEPTSAVSALALLTAAYRRRR